MKRLLGVTFGFVLAFCVLALPAHAADFDDQLHGLKNINSGSKSSTPLKGIAFGSKLVFSAFTDEFGREPWITDGSSGGTKMLANVAAGGVNANPTEFTYFKSHVYFRAFNPTSGNEIWVTNGSESGTRLLKNIASGGQSSNPVALTVAGNYLYFAARETANGQELWRTDGTVAGTVRLTQIAPGMANAEITDIEAIGTRVVFNAKTETGGLEPWVSDGTPAGTKELPINPGVLPGEKDSNPTGFTASGDTVYFSADDGTHGVELWSTRGSVASTQLVKDINPTPISDVPGVGDSNPDQFFAYSGGVLFRASQPGDTGAELWTSDGTEAGTHIVANIGAGSVSGLGTVAGFTEFAGSVYFVAKDDATNFELWVTQGTAETTHIVKDLVPGSVSSDPYDLAVAGPVLTFIATTPATGYEVFQTDGTDAGTTLLKNVRPAATNSNPLPRLVGSVFNTVVYGINDGTNGDEPWVYTSVGSVTKKDTTKVIWSATTAANQQIYIPVAVTAPGIVPIGTVYLIQDDKIVGLGSLYAGKVKIRIEKKLAKGTYQFSAFYAGSVKARSSESDPFTIKVQ